MLRSALRSGARSTPRACPTDPSGEVVRKARVAAGSLPALAPMLGLPMPPPPKPLRSARPARPPRPPRPVVRTPAEPLRPERWRRRDETGAADGGSRARRRRPREVQGRGPDGGSRASRRRPVAGRGPDGGSRARRRSPTEACRSPQAPDETPGRLRQASLQAGERRSRRAFDEARPSTGEAPSRRRPGRGRLGGSSVSR